MSTGGAIQCFQTEIKYSVSQLKLTTRLSYVKVRFIRFFHAFYGNKFKNIQIFCVYLDKIFQFYAKICNFCYQTRDKIELFS